MTKQVAKLIFQSCVNKVINKKNFHFSAACHEALLTESKEEMNEITKQEAVSTDFDVKHY